MKELKFLYETTVNKLVEENVTEKRTEGGSEISVTKKVKKLKPIKLAIIKPNRRLGEQADIFLAKTIGFFVKEGLLSYAQVAKRYNNDGGALSDPEKKRLEGLREEAIALEKRYFELAPSTDDKDTTEKQKILENLNKLNEEVAEVQDSYSNLFDNTAEVKARNRLIDWWTLNLAYIDEDGQGYKPLFGDGNYDAKLLKYDDIEDLEDPFLLDVIQRVGYLVSFWFAARAVVSKFDFVGTEKVYQKSHCIYRPEFEVEAPAPTPAPEVPAEVPVIKPAE